MTPLFDGVHEKTLDCVHCGLCLTACPTYLATGRETSSPRGRIYLMRGVAEGAIQLDGLLQEEAYLCLGCRACETACPSGVRYGELLEETRSAIEAADLRNGWSARLERLALRHIVPVPSRLALLITSLALAQRFGVDKAVIGLLARIPVFEDLAGAMQELHALLPILPTRRERAPLAREYAAIGERRGRVAFFEGCLMPEIFGGVNRATVRVLTRNGFDVTVPPGQGCCGALLAHSGDMAAARTLARRNEVAFAAPEGRGGVAADPVVGVDAIVTNSAGCGAALRESERWLSEGPGVVANRAIDVAAFLDEVGLRAPGSLDPHPEPLRVCYDDPCHLVHAQGVSAAPRRLLESLPGLELVAHRDPEACCGAAGIYNVTHREMSSAVLQRKLDALEAESPEAIATGNPGCLMQLRAGALQRGLGVRVVHPIELIDEAYGPC